MTEDQVETVLARIVRPTLKAMNGRGTPYRGVLYCGLMLTTNGPKLIEFNVRFGDPECQVLMKRLASDVLPLLLATLEGGLRNRAVEWGRQPSITVVMAAPGYPGRPAGGSEIRGVEAASDVPGVTVFHSGTARSHGRLIADGGRVLSVTASAGTLGEARERAYEAVGRISWPEGRYRKDIGLRALGRVDDAARHQQRSRASAPP
jgi:phosphoribosylamine--glycine ligase